MFDTALEVITETEIECAEEDEDFVPLEEEGEWKICHRNVVATSRWFGVDSDLMTNEKGRGGGEEIELNEEEK